MSDGRGAVLLDLDDTLYAYGPCHEAGLAAAHVHLDAAGVAPDPEDFRALHDAVRAELAAELAGQAASHERSLFFKRVVERLTARADAALALSTNAAYWDAFLARMALAPGAPDVLDALAGGHELALVSNHTTAVQLRKIERLGLGRWVPVIVTSEEVGVEKPDARVFARALEALAARGADPTRAVMVGDDPAGDVGGAAAAGLRTVLTIEFKERDGAGPGGRSGGGVAPDATIARLTELPAVVERLLG